MSGQTCYSCRARASVSPARKDQVIPIFSLILCPVDFSEHSKVALQGAAAWARHFSARLIVVTVVEPLLVNAAAAAYEMDLVRSEVLPDCATSLTGCRWRGRTAIPPFEAMVLVGELPLRSSRGAARTRTVDRHCHARLDRLSQAAPGSTTEKVLRQTAVPVLRAPPPEQTPPNVDPWGVDVGRVLVPVDFKDGCVTEVRAAALSLTRLVFRCCWFTWSRRARGSSAFDYNWRRITGSRSNGPTNRSSNSSTRSVRQWASRLRSPSDRQPRRSLRSRSRGVSDSSSWAFDVRSTCSGRGLD